MSQAQTQEPSMEEILASIRRIISDDEPDPEPEVEAPPTAFMPPPEPELDDELMLSDFEPEPAPPAPAPEPDDDILELTELVEEPPLAEVPAMHPVPDHEALISQSTAAVAGAALARLSVTSKTVVSEDSLAEITKALLRPMLKQWLDQHLPGLVESMVQKEIERLTRSVL